MVVPFAMHELNEAHPALRKAPRQKTVVRKTLLARLGAVHLMNRLRLFGNIHQIGNTGLHSVSHLISSDASLNFGVTLALQFQLIQVADDVQGVASNLAGDAFRVGQKEHWIAPGTKRHSLITCRQESGTVAGGATTGSTA